MTFESFLANYNNGDKPSGGDGMLDLEPLHLPHTRIIHCLLLCLFFLGPDHYRTYLFMYKNGMQVPESQWYYSGGSLSGNVGVIGSRIVMSYFLEIFLTESVAQFDIAIFSRFSTWMQKKIWT